MKKHKLVNNLLVFQKQGKKDLSSSKALEHVSDQRLTANIEIN